MLLFADTGWDEDEKWWPSLLEQLRDFHCFLPNSDEAMAYTRTDDPNDALHALADRVPVAVVTCGGQGALAIDSVTGEQEWVPSAPGSCSARCAAGRCGSGSRSPTCARRCRYSTSAAPWRRRAGATSSTGSP